MMVERVVSRSAYVDYRQGAAGANPLSQFLDNRVSANKKSGVGYVPISALVFPGTRVAEATPVLSLKPHREALAVAVDPETAMISKHIAPTQEGGLHRLPAKPTLATGLSSIRVIAYGRTCPP